MTLNAISPNTLIPLLIFSLLRLILGIQLVILGVRNKETNLHWLAVSSLIGALFAPFLALNLMVTTISNIITEICLLMFVHSTFYRGRPSPVWVLMGIVGIFFLGAVWFAPASMTNPTGDWGWPITATVAVFIGWAWHFIAAWQAYRSVAQDALVEDWVKTRYQIMLIYCGLYMATPLYTITRPFTVPTAPLAPFLPLFLLPIILSLVFQFIAWVMPAGVRNWLNRNYKPPVVESQFAEMSEEELMRRLIQGT